jgi:integrase/recombinase XerC
MQQEIEQYLSKLNKEKNYSHNTIISYRNDLNQLHRFLKNTFELIDYNQVQFQHLRDWQMALMKEGMHARTVRRKLSCVRQFFKYLNAAHTVKENPAALLKNPRMESKLPELLSESRIVQTLNHLEQSELFNDQRDYMVLLLLYACGLRKAELINLQLRSVERDQSFLRVLGKGDKERIVPLGQKVLKSIERYIKLRKRAFESCGHNYLILTDKGLKLYPKFVFNLVNKYFNTSKIGKVYPHMLRHSFATHLLEKGAKIEHVRKLLGHTSLAATQVYTRLSMERIMDVYKDKHPRS